MPVPTTPIPTIRDVVSRLYTIADLAGRKAQEAVEAVRDTPDHRREDLAATLEDVEERLDGLFD